MPAKETTRQESLDALIQATIAAQLCLPISVCVNRCDQKPERENEVVKLNKRHIQQFFMLYQAR